MSPVELTHDTPQTGDALPSPSDLSPGNYAFLQAYIQSESGIVLDEDKRYLVESRLLPIVQKKNIASLDMLCRLLAAKASPALSKQVVEAMANNETLFFRDENVFEALRAEVLPSLFRHAGGRRKVRIWSAAASSGQEAYSLAMLALEAGKGRDQVEILGTDLSEQVLERARQGRYLQFEVNRGLPAPLLAKYFRRAGPDWQLQDEVRRMVRFEPLDLRRSLKAMAPYDLILCRNVLIYFSVETKKQILAAVKETLRPGGTLVLGCAETAAQLDDGFQRYTIGQSAFYSV